MTIVASTLWFFTGPLALIIGFASFILVLTTKRSQLWLLALLLLVISMTTAFWWFDTLGVGLGDKTGTLAIPQWEDSLPRGTLIGSIIFFGALFYMVDSKGSFNPARLVIQKFT